MDNIKRKQIKAYILWESLLAIAILASLASLFLGQLTHHQKQLALLEKEAQALSVATMAIQTKQRHLQKNGQDIVIRQSDHKTIIMANGKEMLRVTVLSP